MTAARRDRARRDWTMRGTATTLVAGGLLALFGWMAAACRASTARPPTRSSPVTSGYSYWKLGDFRLLPDAGDLPQRWAAAPLLARDLHFPALDQPAWLNADVGCARPPVFYESGNDPPGCSRRRAHHDGAARRGVRRAGVRLVRSLFGARGALVSTALFAFCPNLLAHAGLATMPRFRRYTTSTWR